MAKIGQELFQARGIDRATFCSGCCYNLMTRPIIGRCPECGQTYDARSLGRRGILEPGVARLPIGDLFTTLITFAIAGLLFHQGYKQPAPGLYLLGTPFLIMAGFLCRGTWRKMAWAMRLRSLQREAIVQAEEADP